MTAAVDMLAAVRALGGDVKLANSGRLKVIAPAPLPNELIERLRAAKPDLLTLLAKLPGAIAALEPSCQCTFWGTRGRVLPSVRCLDFAVPAAKKSI